MNKTRTLAAVGSLVLTAIAVPRAQPQAPAAPTFEVASIKPNNSNTVGVTIGMQPGGRYVATNATVRMLIRQAYQVQDFQIVSGPNWLNADHFDLTAKAEGEVPPAATGTGGQLPQLPLMLRALLAERFKLVVHSETRELPVYALVPARLDGKLGANLRLSAVDCPAMATARGRDTASPPIPGERPTCGVVSAGGRMSGGGISLSVCAISLSALVQRPVIDRTGLLGTFDFDLSWTPDAPQAVTKASGTQSAEGPAPPPANGVALDPNGGPSIFTAVPEQLGLKLDSQRGPVDIVVIDHAEHPTPD